MSDSSGEEAARSKELGPSATIRQVTFGVALPPSLGHETDLPKSTTESMGDAGIVGSMLVLRNAAIIWLGWGHVNITCDTKGIEGHGIPTMGSLVVAFPRISYKGCSNGEASCSQLLGGDSEDQMLGWQIAGRLSQQLGYPIFVSCALFESDPPEWMIGLDRSVLTQRAAAIAERKVRQLLKDHFSCTK